jgi:hypothetical protein
MAFLAAPLIAEAGEAVAPLIASKLAPYLGSHANDVARFAVDKGSMLAQHGFKKLANNIYNMGRKNKSIRTLFKIGQKAARVLGDAGVNRNTIKTGIDIAGNIMGKDMSKVHEAATKAMAIHDSLGKLTRMENKNEIHYNNYLGPQDPDFDKTGFDQYLYEEVPELEKYKDTQGGWKEKYTIQDPKHGRILNVPLMLKYVDRYQSN